MTLLKYLLCAAIVGVLLAYVVAYGLLYYLFWVFLDR
jgi:hypothetical protein